MNHTDLARSSIQALLDGNPPNGVAPVDCGPWQETRELLDAAHARGGPAEVRKLFGVLSAKEPALAKLIAAAAKPMQDDEPPAAPELPPHVIVPEQAGAADWLDAYIEHSRTWSPRSFDDYHETIGIWLLSTVAARRVVAHLGGARYTPLCLALAGRSTLYAKTTAANVGIDVLYTAGLDWLLAIDSATPQKFVLDRTQRVPDGYTKLDDAAQARTRLRLSFAGQCGWWYDEFGMLLASMARSGSVMSDFSGLLRKFDDCAPTYRAGSIGRGTDEIIAPYLALLASLTPADLRPLMKRGSGGWTNGLWPRWAFACPPEGGYRTDRFPGGVRKPPFDVVQQLRAWHDDLGVPDIRVSDDGDGWAAHVGPLPQRAITVAPAVVEAYYAYSDALIATIAESSVDELDSWYGRVHDRALRVAVLLASVHGAERVELGHWARAQAISERWRASIHRIYDQVNTQQEATVEATSEEAVLQVIQRLGNPSGRDIKTRITWLSRGQIQEICDRMVATGTIMAVPTSHTTRYALPIEIPTN